MNKVTKIQIRDYVKHKLSTDPLWATRALIRIYDFQTNEEQASDQTIDHNGVGFSGTDGEIFSSFAKQFERRGSLSDKQMYLVFKKMPKYWHQIVRLSNQEQLEQQILSHLNHKK